jgi:selenocysteine lyase/cysteine desulfurase
MPPGLDLAGLKAALERRKVVASLRGTALRLSPSVYNDEGDVDALLSVLRESVG